MFINHPNLNDLLISMINIKVFCPQFHDVVIVDTTCLLTLKQIYQECMDDHSERGQLLNMLANKTIYVMQDIKYHCLGDLQRELLCERDNRNGNKRRSAKVEVGKQLYGHKYDYAKQTAQGKQLVMDQNINYLNVINCQERKRIIVKSERLDHDWRKNIKEINRPEYLRTRSQQQICVNQQQMYVQSGIPCQFPLLIRQPTPIHAPLRRTQLKPSLSSPINLIHIGNPNKTHNKQNSQQQQQQQGQSADKPTHSINSQVSLSIIPNIKQSSWGNCDSQTQTDNSLQIDLQNIVSHFQQSKRQPRRKQESKGIELSQRVRKVYKTDDQGIVEEQPWQCDQEELEEDLRKINNQLSQRTIQPRQKIDLPLPALPLQKIITPRAFTKVVKLSLTPRKKKTAKQNVKELNNYKTPIRDNFQDIPARSPLKTINRSRSVSPSEPIYEPPPKEHIRRPLLTTKISQIQMITRN